MPQDKTIDKNGIVRHANPTQYTRPDADVSRRMRSGMAAVTIPKATRDGASMGFKAGVAPITVDPTNPENGAGGLTVDLSQISPQASKLAYEQAARMTADDEERIIQAYKLMGVQTFQPEIALTQAMPAPRENPIFPNAYVVPASRGTGAQLIEAYVEPTRTVEEPVRIPTVVRRQPSQDQDVILGAISGLQQTVAMLVNNQLQQKQVEVHVPTKPTIPDEDEEIPQTSVKLEEKKERMYTEREAVEAIKKGFSELKIPDLSHIPNKPKFRVEFNLGQLGSQEAWFHWVLVEEAYVVAIFDKRYENGIRYLAPTLTPDKTITIRLPDQQKSYKVHSLGLQLDFGVFSISILPLAETVPMRGSADEALSSVTTLLDNSFSEQEASFFEGIMGGRD